MNRKKILITGGAGFIGSHVVRLFTNKYADYSIFNLDNLLLHIFINLPIDEVLKQYFWYGQIPRSIYALLVD